MAILPGVFGAISQSAGGAPFTLWGGIINQYSISGTVWRSHTFRGDGL